jgi:cytochrome c
MNMKLVLVLTTLALGLSGGVAFADEELYKARNCMACHRVDRATLGPSFKSIAAKYADAQGAEAMLATRIREGGVGVWGQVPMPAQPQVSAEEAVILARWILGLK